ncbi:MAG: hypothetical protein Tsb0015_09710 [Simkaniaceae bacterium]
MIQKINNAVFAFKDSDGVLHQGTADHFSQMTGAGWTDKMILSSKEMPIFHPSTREWELMRFLRPLYQVYRKNPPKLYIQQGTAKGKHALFAAQPIKKGAIVVEYLGEWAPENKIPSSYRFGPIDAKRFRNLAALAEDGFPNLAAFYLYQTDGLPMRIVYLALEDIPEGKILTVNYGLRHSVKIHWHAEYREKELVYFFQKQPFAKYVLRIWELLPKKTSELSWTKILELENLTAKFQYLFSTPSSLAKLLFLKILSAEEVFTFFDKLDNRFYFLGFSLHPHPKQQEIIEYLHLLKSLFQETVPYQKRLLGWIGQVSVRSFFKVLIYGALQKHDFQRLQMEAMLWDKSFQAIQNEDKKLLQHLIKKSMDKSRLLQECLKYAQETHSPLLAWIKQLLDPRPPILTAA